MKRVAIMPLLALIAVAIGCSSDGGAGLDLPLGPAPWKDGDRLVYDMMDPGGNKAGTLQYCVKKDGNAWVLSSIDKTARIEQDIVMRVDSGTLRPLGEEKTINAMGTTVKVKSAYKEGKLEISGVVNGQDKSASVDVPATAIDNDQLQMTLRALKFVEGFEAPLVHIVGLSGLDVDAAIAVKGKETIDVPAGSFETWVVELDFGQTKHRAWYQVASPQNMIQYDKGIFKLVLSK